MIKSFKDTLITEDKSRFVNKNPHLHPKEKEEINKFLKINNQADGKLDANKATTMTYSEFQAFMTSFTSGRKMVLAHKGIKGLNEGKDYIHVKTKSTEYLCYIPLNYATAQKFNTDALGVCQGSWCVGHSSSPQYWDEHMIDNQEVPIYVINTKSKWVVMIQEHNKDFDIWDINNIKPMPHDSIPNFDVHKELMTPALDKLYDELRADFFHEDNREQEDIDTSAAEEDYDHFIRDVEHAQSQYENAYEEFHNECSHIKDSTLEKYEQLRDAKEKAKDILHKNMTVAKAMKNDKVFASLEAKHDAVEKEYEKLDELCDEIENIAPHEMSDHDEINWTSEPPQEEYIHDHINFPSIHDGRYSDYFDLAEERMGFNMRGGEGEDLETAINEYIYGYANTQKHVAQILSYHSCYHPDSVNEH